MTLVSADEQLVLFDELLAACQGGQGSAIVVSGPAGSGKTEVLRRFGDRAAGSGVRFLLAGAARAERALPFVVLRQLFHDAELPPESAEQARRLLSLGADLAARYDPDSEVGEQAMAPTLYGLAEKLLALAQYRPLVVGVDDVHNADVPSLQCLLYLVRRASSAQMLLAFTERTPPRQLHPPFLAELVRQPQCHWTQLGLLSQAGVATIVARELDPSAAHRLAADIHQTSGGNPLLVRALVDDYRAAVPTDLPRLVTGDAYAQAVMSCLFRCGSTFVKVAQGLAVLAAPLPPSAIAKLLDMRAGAVTHAVDTLNATGLLAAGRFRHPAARAAVLASIAAEERSTLHTRAARVLHNTGASPTIVAKHLVAADRLDASWGIPLLADAAEQALAAGAVDFAVQCLYRAEQECTDGRQRVSIKLALARAEWRARPATAIRHLPNLADAVRDGVLDGQGLTVPIEYLLWFGRFDEAAEALGQLITSSERPGSERLSETQLRLLLFYPGLNVRLRDLYDLPEFAQSTVPATGDPQFRASAALATATVSGRGRDATALAGQVLRSTPLDDATLTPILTALTAMIYADALDEARNWCEMLLAEAAQRRAATWTAQLTATDAWIRLLCGDLSAASDQARAAIEEISVPGWGVAIGGPLSVLVRAETALGRYDEAAEHLRLPVPAAMFETPAGLRYLHARGRHFLATGRYYAALSDLLTCWDLMRRWGRDHPVLVPWRSDVALARIGMGQHEQAVEIVREEIDLLGEAPSPTLAYALRVLASASPPAQRPSLLLDAVQMLHASQSKVELPGTLQDLRQAMDALDGECRDPDIPVGAAQMIQDVGHPSADQVARTPVPPSLRALPEQVGAAPAGLGDPRRLAELSNAERRVAALAALGQTNRQIAAKLCITVSTVEQHLTKVYRKLDVGRRADLKHVLPMYAAGWPSSVAVA